MNATFEKLGLLRAMFSEPRFPKEMISIVGLPVPFLSLLKVVGDTSRSLRISNKLILVTRMLAQK